MRCAAMNSRTRRSMAREAERIAKWLGWDSNPRPGGYESPALDRTELPSRLLLKCIGFPREARSEFVIGECVLPPVAAGTRRHDVFNRVCAAARERNAMLYDQECQLTAVGTPAPITLYQSSPLCCGERACRGTTSGAIAVPRDSSHPRVRPVVRLDSRIDAFAISRTVATSRRVVLLRMAPSPTSHALARKLSPTLGVSFHPLPVVGTLPFWIREGHRAI